MTMIAMFYLFWEVSLATYLVYIVYDIAKTAIAVREERKNIIENKDLVRMIQKK